MIRLNNKGFAVSTILYGILSLTIIILMMIFGVMKSNKDMNQDLAESMENQLNNCVLSEVKLEECYFSGGSCDYTEYNNCNGRKVETNFLANVATVGDFVNYDAGAWTSTVAVPTQNYEFGGYQAGVSRNNSVKCSAGDYPENQEMYNGWRVLSIKDGIVTLVHAGISECYYAADGPRMAFNHVYLLTGKETTGNESGAVSTIRNWNDYVNGDYASSARIITKSEAVIKIRRVNATYLLPNAVSGDFPGEYIETVANGRITSSSGVLGIRPVVVLKEGIRVSGSITNTYGGKEWLLIR